MTEPYGTPGNRFVFMRDPDGIYLKLEESPIPKPGSGGNQTQILGMPYIGINVSDVEASVDFYERFGYSSVRWINEQTLSAEESAAWGFDRPVRYRGADIAITRGDHHRLRLLQWIEPFDPEPAYPPPINHKGINRLALTVPDVERATRILQEQGVPFLSEVAPCCSGTDTDTGGIVHAIDPDGVFLELVGNLTPRPGSAATSHCPPLGNSLPRLSSALVFVGRVPFGHDPQIRGSGSATKLIAQQGRAVDIKRPASGFLGFMLVYELSYRFLRHRVSSE